MNTLLADLSIGAAVAIRLAPAAGADRGPPITGKHLGHGLVLHRDRHTEAANGVPPTAHWRVTDGQTGMLIVAALPTPCQREALAAVWERIDRFRQPGESRAEVLARYRAKFEDLRPVAADRLGGLAHG